MTLTTVIRELSKVLEREGDLPVMAFQHEEEEEREAEVSSIYVPETKEYVFIS